MQGMQKVMVLWNLRGWQAFRMVRGAWYVGFLRTTYHAPNWSNQKNRSVFGKPTPFVLRFIVTNF